MSGLVTVGDNVVDTYLDLGLRFPGGNAVNVAVAARRSDVRSAYVGVVGNDDAGEAIRGALLSEGVGVDRLRVEQGATAFSNIEVRGGDRVFADHGLGVSRFELDEADLQYLAGFDCIHTGDNSGLESEVAKMAEVGPVSYDFSDRPFEYCEPLLGHVWLASYSGASLPPPEAAELAEAILERGPSYVLVTRGAEGAVLFCRDTGPVAVEAVPTPPVDTLGAGDTVIGCLLAGLLKGDAPATAMKEAMVRAAQTCSQYGAFGYGLPPA